MNEFLLGFLTCLGVLFYVWSVVYAAGFFVERGIETSFGTLVIVLIPLLNSVLAILYFKKGGKRV